MVYLQSFFTQGTLMLIVQHNSTYFRRRLLIFDKPALKLRNVKEEHFITQPHYFPFFRETAKKYIILTNNFWFPLCLIFKWWQRKETKVWNTTLNNWFTEENKAWKHTNPCTHLILLLYYIWILNRRVASKLGLKSQHL